MKKRRAFTLIELLVVVGILSVLMGILLPVMQTARQKARGAACQSNLHQMGEAMAAYREAHDMYIPSRLLADLHRMHHAAPSGGGWMAATAFAADRPGAASTAFTDFCDPSILLCPATRGTSSLSYGVNGHLLDVGRAFFLRQDPVQLPLVFDARVPEAYYYSDLDFRHVGDANILYADYHVAPNYVHVVKVFTHAVPLPSGRRPWGAAGPGAADPNDFALENGVVTSNTQLRATLTVLGGAYTGTQPIQGWYRHNGGTPQWLTKNARLGSSSLAIDFAEGDTLTVLGRVRTQPTYESDDGSGHCWSLRDGDPVPLLQGYLDQPSVRSYVESYVDPTGHIDIPSNAVIYLFELSSSTDYGHVPWADFQDLVVLVTFDRVPGDAGAPTGGDSGGGSQGDSAVVGATFSANNLSVTVTSTKDLSNVTLNLEDGSTQKFENLSGYTATFAATGPHRGKRLTGVWIKSGSNKSGDGPGLGEYVDNPNL